MILTVMRLLTDFINSSESTSQELGGGNEFTLEGRRRMASKREVLYTELRETLREDS